MRMTTDRVPNTNALAKEIALPLGIIVKPYGDLPTVSNYDFLLFLRAKRLFQLALAKNLS